MRLGVIFTLLCCTAWADPISITYTGQNFTLFSGAYNASDHLLITLDLADPLTANMGTLGSHGDPVNLTPVSWTATDGVHFLSSKDCLDPNTCAAGGQFTTDASGSLVQWDIVVMDNGTRFEVGFNPWADQGDGAYSLQDWADSPCAGSWSVPQNGSCHSTPEPPTGILLGMSLTFALIWIIRRLSRDPCQGEAPTRGPSRKSCSAEPPFPE